MSPQSMRAKFATGGLETASPAKIVLMAFDRLDRDLAGAVVEIEARRVERSHELLVHAQELVNELLCMLDLDAWEHAEQLAAIYRYVIELLVSANVCKETRQVGEARTLLAGLGDAFRQAAVQAAAPAPVAPAMVAPAPAAVGAASPSAVVTTKARPTAFAGPSGPGRSFSASA